MHLHQVVQRELLSKLLAILRLLSLKLLIDLPEPRYLLVFGLRLLVDLLFPFLEIEVVILLHIVLLPVDEELLVLFVGQVDLLLEG